MADRKLSEMSIDATLDGTERILAQGADGSVILVSGLVAYAIDELVGAAEITPTAGDAFVVERSGTEGTYAIADAEAWVVDTIEAVGVSTIVDADWIIFSDAGVLKKITLANLAASFTNFPISVLDIDGGTDIGAGAPLVDADEIIVDNGGGGTNVRCDMSHVYDYIEDKIQAQAGKAADTPVDGDILTIQDSADSSTLKELTVGGLWDNRYLADMRAVSDVKTATWVVDEDTLTSNLDTKVPTQQSVKAYVDARTIAGVSSFTGEVDPANDLVLISDAGTIENATYQVFMDGIADLTAATIATGDSLVFIDSGSSSVARIETVDDLFEIGPALVTADTVDMTVDHMLFLDGGATGAANKCSIQSLFNSVTAIIGGDVSLGITGQTQGSGVAGGAVVVTGAPAVGTANGGLVSATGGTGGGATGNGGAVSLAGGLANSNGDGGAATVSGGDSAGSGDGGDTTVEGGAGGTAGIGGKVDIDGGLGSTTAVGGAVEVNGGGNTDGSGNGGAVNLTGGACSSSSTGDGGAATLAGGASSGGATGDGGTVTIDGGDSTTTSGNGGDITMTAGLSTGANQGGLVAITAGAGGAAGAGGTTIIAGGAPASGNAAGGLASVTGGAGSGTGVGGDASLSGGAAAGSADGGDVILTGGTSGSGVAGKVHVRSKMLGYQDITPETATDTASLTDAQILAGILVCTPTGAATYTMRTGTEIETAIGGTLASGDSFDLSIINLGGAGDIITMAVAAGVTFVGSLTVDDAGADINSSGVFRFVRGAANVFVGYRVA